MATKILIKRNTTTSNAPGTSDLEIGELSLNLYGTNSGTLYTKNDLKELKDDAIKLGLDLQGGMYVVLEADIPTLLLNLTDKKSEELKNAINHANDLTKTALTPIYLGSIAACSIDDPSP